MIETPDTVMKMSEPTTSFFYQVVTSNTLCWAWQHAKCATQPIPMVTAMECLISTAGDLYLIQVVLNQSRASNMVSSRAPRATRWSVDWPKAFVYTPLAFSFLEFTATLLSNSTSSWAISSGRLRATTRHKKRCMWAHRCRSSRGWHKSYAKPLQSCFPVEQLNTKLSGSTGGLSGCSPIKKWNWA